MYTLTKQSRKSNSLISSKHLKFQALPIFRLPPFHTASLPVGRPGFAGCSLPDISQEFFSHIIFTNLNPLNIGSQCHLHSFLLTIIGLPSSSFH